MFKKRLASLAMVGVLAAAFALPATTAGADGGVGGGCGYAANDLTRNTVDTGPGPITAFYNPNAQGRDNAMHGDTQVVSMFWGITSSHKDAPGVKTLITYGNTRDDVSVGGKSGVLTFGGASVNGGVSGAAGLYNFTVIVDGKPVGSFTCAVLDHNADSN